MADVTKQAQELGIDPSGYGDDDESQKRLQERIKQVQAERDSFPSEAQTVEGAEDSGVATSRTVQEPRTSNGSKNNK